jgi:hypothetical protein
MYPFDLQDHDSRLEQRLPRRAISQGSRSGERNLGAERDLGRDHVRSRKVSWLGLWPIWYKTMIDHGTLSYSFGIAVSVLSVVALAQCLIL